ncbi:hypothetical protein LOD99_2384 [Oopsacas minuta]|uniref:Uncharacterized protein n=1 Tax=Oopsacas minuta TaxID=111878 RepID=A0AAV7K212_9METZ|nr:hypothetical protein LOD99_2384 [Oopsacas minuta]
MEGDKGAVLYTGPDGISDFKVVVKDQFHIGVGTASAESTLGVDYICRGYIGQPFPINRGKAVGEVGWETSKIPNEKLCDSANRIKLQEFRQVAEDRYTHRYQNPFFAGSTSTSVDIRIQTATAEMQDKKSQNAQITPPLTEPNPKVLTLNVPESSSVTSSTSTLPAH